MLLDSYLSHPRISNVHRTKLQLIGLASLLISSKIEEVRPPNLSDLKMICDDLYSKKEISEMELEICATLQWNLTPMNLLTWTRYYLMKEGKVLGDVPDAYSLKSEDYTADNRTDNTDVIEGVLDYLIHFPEVLNFKPSKLSLATISILSINSTLPHKDLIIEESNCIRNLLSSAHTHYMIAYCDPKRIGKLNVENFENLIKDHRKSLNLILKRIKSVEI